MTLRSTLRALPLALLVIGCVPRTTPLTQAYVPPTSGKLAKLQLRSAKLVGNSTIYTFDNPRTCTSPRIMTDSVRTGGQVQDSASILAEGPRTLWFNFRNSLTNRYCNVVMTFASAPDKNYAVQVFATDTNCSMSVSDITDPTNPFLVRHYYQRKLSPTATQSGEYCVAADVDAELAKSAKRNLSGLKMDDLKDLLPPDPASGAKP